MQDFLLQCSNYEIEFPYRMMLFKEEFCLFSKGSDTLDSWCYLKAYSFLCLLTPLPHSLFLGITITTIKSLPSSGPKRSTEPAGPDQKCQNRSNREQKWLSAGDKSYIYICTGCLLRTQGSTVNPPGELLWTSV